MKLLTKISVVAALLMMCSATSFAQKFGYINSQELIVSMPDYDSVQVKMEKYSQELDDQLETIQVEFNNKLAEFQKNSATYSPAIAQLKEKELTALRDRFQEFNQTAQQDVQNMQSQLMMPVVTKAQDAIKKVCKANSFTMVYDLAAGALIYYDDAVVNVLSLVQAELKITPKPAATATQTK